MSTLVGGDRTVTGSFLSPCAPPSKSPLPLQRSSGAGEMWGVGFSLALAAFLQVELGIAAAESGVSQPPESDPPFAWDETLPDTMVNWTSDAPEPAPPACHGGEDCPPWSSCEEDHVGRQICRCGLGYHLHPVFGCVPVKVFAAQLTVCNLEPPESSSLLVARQVQRLFRCLLGHLDGYLDSLVHALNRSGQEVTILHHFSAWGPVTSHKVDTAMDAFRVQCHSSLQGTPFCDHAGAYKALNLCKLNVCDPFSTTCSSPDGLVGCTCHPGFFRAHAMDRTCTGGLPWIGLGGSLLPTAACESGFWLQNGTCIRCPFGFGGAACQEPLLLALVGVSCFAGLLLWLLLALLLFRRAPPAQETPVALPLPLRSRVLSLPRVRPPGPMPELEDCPPFVLDPEREGLPAEGAPRMKTFWGSRGPPPSAPQTVGGCSNLVFIGDAGEPAEQDHF